MKIENKVPVNIEYKLTPNSIKNIENEYSNRSWADILPYLYDYILPYSSYNG